MTSNILADSLEALLGAISIDCGHQQEQLFAVIKHLWQPYIEIKPIVPTVSAIPATGKLAAPIVTSSAPSQVTNRSKAVPDSVPADYQRVFTGVSMMTPVASFEKYVAQVNDINRRNVGKKGNPVLMVLLNKKKLRKTNELPKIKILLDQGADWKATNIKGVSAAELARRQHGGQKAVLKRIHEL